VVALDGQVSLLDEPSEAVGIRSWTKPVITELPISSDTYVLAFTDGLVHAGRRYGRSLDVSGLICELLSQVEDQGRGCVPAQLLADAILDRALEAEQGRPSDDISVVVVAILPVILPAAQESGRGIRRMSVRFPIRIKREGDGGGRS
jgi:serine phosphatase RsbU (regulator of sigma subunit)